jgi:hypothetical protein
MINNNMKNHRNLVVSLDFGKMPDWAIQAKNRQMADWVHANIKSLPFENLIILPSVGESRLYWLEGKIDDETDLQTIREMKDKLKPVLEIALGITIDSSGYIDPKTAAIEELKKHREEKLKDGRQ